MRHDRQRVAHHQPLNVQTPGAERKSDGDFRTPARDAVGDDAVQTEHRKRQRDDRHAGRENGE